MIVLCHIALPALIQHFFRSPGIEEIMAMNIDEDLKQALLQSMLEYRHEMGSGNEDAPADDDVGGAAKKRVLTRDSNSTHQPPSKRIREKQPENNNGVSHG